MNHVVASGASGSRHLRIADILGFYFAFIGEILIDTH